MPLKTPEDYLENDGLVTPDDPRFQYESAGVVGALEETGQMFVDSPTRVLGAIGRAVEGSDPYASDNFADRWIAEDEALTTQQMREGGAEQPTILGATRGDFRQAGASLGFSGVSALGGLGAGIAGELVAPTVPGSGLVTGAVTSGALAYRMSSNEFIRRAVEFADQAQVESTGNPLSLDQKRAVVAEFAPQAMKYGLWEAVPEAASNALGFKLLSAPLKKFMGKNAMTRFGSKVGSFYGQELGTEIITGMGQQQVEVEAGMTDEPARSFKEPGDYLETAKEIAAPTIIQSTILGGGVQAGIYGTDKYKQYRDARIAKEQEREDQRQTFDDIQAADTPEKVIEEATRAASAPIEPDPQYVVDGEEIARMEEIKARQEEAKTKAQGLGEQRETTGAAEVQEQVREAVQGLPEQREPMSIEAIRQRRLDARERARQETPLRRGVPEEMAGEYAQEEAIQQDAVAREPIQGEQLGIDEAESVMPASAEMGRILGDEYAAKVQPDAGLRTMPAAPQEDYQTRSFIKDQGIMREGDQGPRQIIQTKMPEDKVGTPPGKEAVPYKGVPDTEAGLATAPSEPYQKKSFIREAGIEKPAEPKPKKFTPTHTLSDGTQVRSTGDENVWRDAEGSEYEESGVQSINRQKRNNRKIKEIEKKAKESAGPSQLELKPEAGVRNIDDAANEAATSDKNDTPKPTEAQIEAGNYKKGHVAVQGLDVTIENPKGSYREGTNEAGEKWSIKMPSHYGYIKRTDAADGEQLDVFVGPDQENENNSVYVVDQVLGTPPKFDEHKVMLGFKSKGAAESGYKAGYEAGWDGMGEITEMSADEFKEWVKSGDQTKPLAWNKKQDTEKTQEPMTKEARVNAINNLIKCLKG